MERCERCQKWMLEKTETGLCDECVAFLRKEKAKKQNELIELYNEAIRLARYESYGAAIDFLVLHREELVFDPDLFDKAIADVDRIKDEKFYDRI